MRLRDLFDDLRDDVRFAVRGLRRDKVMASFIVVTLALGIGANAAMFSAVDRLLIRGPSYIADPSRVMRFYRTRHAGPNGDVTGAAFGWVSYDNFKHATHSFANVAAYSVNSTTFGAGADAVLIPFGAATYDLFPAARRSPRARPVLRCRRGRAGRAATRRGHRRRAVDARVRRATAPSSARKVKLGDEDYTHHRRCAARLHGSAARAGGCVDSDVVAVQQRHDPLVGVVEFPVAANRRAPQAGREPAAGFRRRHGCLSSGVRRERTASRRPRFGWRRSRSTTTATRRPR